MIVSAERMYKVDIHYTPQFPALECSTPSRALHRSSLLPLFATSHNNLELPLVYLVALELRRTYDLSIQTSIDVCVELVMYPRDRRQSGHSPSCCECPTILTDSMMPGSRSFDF